VRAILSPRAALLVLPLLAGTGCGGTLAATGSARFEGLVQRDAHPPAAVQLAPAVAWASPVGAREAQAGYASIVVLEGVSAPLIRHRAHAETTSGRASGVHPFARFSLDYGTIRPGDLTADELLDVQGQPPLLTSYAYRAEAGWQGALRRRTRIHLILSADRSAGVGSDLAALPDRSRLKVTARGAHLRTRAHGLEGGASLSRYASGGAALLLEGDLGTSLRVSRDLTVSAVGGGAAAHTSLGSGVSALKARPVAGLAASFTSPGLRGAAARASLMTRPEFDRSDGGLRQRLQLQGTANVPVAPGARLATSLQWAGDLVGAGERRSTVTADISLHQKLTGSWDVVVGVRSSLHGSPLSDGGTPSPQERLHAGVSRRAGIR